MLEKRGSFIPSFFATNTVRFLLVILAATLSVLGVPTARVHAAAGGLDPSFGNGGKVTTDFGAHSDRSSALALQADGKIVVAGGSLGNGDLANFALTRYNQDGSLDSTFGVAGKVITSFGASVAFALGIQSDGKIIAAGGVIIGTQSFALARYNTDGSLDVTFGSGGKVTTIFSGASAVVSALVISGDGKIVVAGSAFDFNNGDSDFALARYNPDGSLDLTFGSAGRVVTDFSGDIDIAFGMALQPNGRIIAVGNTLNLNSQTNTDFAAARYDTSGNLDVTFGLGGKVVTDFSGSIDDAFAVTIQQNGKVIVAGDTSFQTSNYNFGLVRYNSDGSLDLTFGSDGKVSTDFFLGTDRARAVALQADGKIVAVGVADTSRGPDFGLCRYTADGSLDSGFGSGGKVTTDFFPSGDQFTVDDAFSIAIQSDGKIIAGGESFGSSDTDYDFALARYDADRSFESCLQDDSNGNLIQFNSTSGDYQFTNCSGLTLNGTASLIRKGSMITLQHNAADRRVLVRSDGNVKRGTASIQVFSSGTTFTITDRNTGNNTCSCTAAFH